MPGFQDCYNNNKINSVVRLSVPSVSLNPKMYLTFFDNLIICMVLVTLPGLSWQRHLTNLFVDTIQSIPLICKSIKLKSYVKSEMVVRRSIILSLPGAGFDVRNHAPIANPTLPIRLLSRGTGNKVDLDWWWASRVGLFLKNQTKTGTDLTISFFK